MQAGERPTRIVDCSLLSAPSPGCRSYNEMVTNSDPELIRVLYSSTSFVCFRPNQDVFFTISYHEPQDDSLFVETKSGSGTYEQDSVLSYYRFKSGVVDEFQTFSGKWRKFGKAGQAFFTAAPSAEGGGASVDDTEANVQYGFKNLAGTETAYSVSVRRSTLRFLESYEWGNPAPPQEESASNARKDSVSKGADDVSGYCRYFPGQDPTTGTILGGSGT